jgi:L-aminopeptidase/D-esterase-like protein
MTGFINTEEVLISQYDQARNVFSGNTTIGIVATNAKLTKSQAKKMASMAHNGYARTMRPAHSMFDGDTIFTLGTGFVEADVNVVGLLAARVVENAVLRGVMNTSSLLGYKAYRDLHI